MMENIGEVWKEIKDYPQYQISNTGKIWSSKRNKCLKTQKINNGYITVMLRTTDGKSKRKLVHRLVALTFLDNPNEYSCVNHKDENKENNTVENLEWCSRSYNINYGLRNKKAAEKISKPVIVIETGEEYESLTALAKALNSSVDIVSMVLHNRNRCKTVKGYHIKFAK